MEANTAPKPVWPLVLFLGLFAAGVLGAWGWFTLGVDEGQGGLWIDSSIEASPNYRFQPDELSESALNTLATTNILNGAFLPIASEGNLDGVRSTSGVISKPAPFRVFLASWGSLEKQDLSVVQHTPDVCWEGAGWTSLSLGQPRSILVPLNGFEIPFECRVFEAPGSGHRELVIWCTLLRGQVLEESVRFAPEGDSGEAGSKSTAFRNARFLALGQFLNTVRTRRAGGGIKQFVRYSIAYDGDWDRGIETLRNLGPLWLKARPLGARAENH